MAVTLVRRAFLQSLGLSIAGLAVGLSRAGEKNDEKGTAPPTLAPNVFVHIAPDGATTIACHRSEMGQGVRSTLPVLIADELGADMKRVTIVQADGDKAYGDQNTDGSSSVRAHYEELRRVGAAARMLLVAAAAKKWKVDRKTCVARDHVVTHPPTKRSIDFGALVADAVKLPSPKNDEIVLRPESDLTLVFKALPLLDGKDVVTGRALFAADVRLDGMLVAVVARPPVVGGKAKKIDSAAALAVAGVKKVIELPAPKPPFAFQSLGGVAVIADTTWAAMRGRAALKIEWEAGDDRTYDSIAYRDELLKAVRAPGKVVRKIGDVDAAIAGAKKKVEAEYVVPHLSHVPMEPPAAIARFDASGTCEVWACTQSPQTARSEVAKALGVDESKVTMHVTLLGGGFGRKSKPDFCVEAALLAKAAGAPVRVQWMREDDVRHDYYHSTCAARLVASLDDEGAITGWLHRNAFPSIRSTFRPNVTLGDVGELQQGVLDYPLSPPNVRAENCEAIAHVRIGWLRSVHNINAAFAIGSFIDEIAVARGADPMDVLREVIGPPRIVGLGELGVEKLPNYGAPLDKHPVDVGRFHKVLDRMATISDWKNARKTRAMGVHVHRSFLTYVAVVVACSKPVDGMTRIEEAWIVADAGKVLNLERARAQMEGAVVFGMSIALHGAITMKDGAVEQSNFRDYKLARIGEVPKKIHVEIVASDRPPGGIGEPGVPPVAPAIANAVFAATGVRVRELPIARSGLV